MVPKGKQQMKKIPIQENLCKFDKKESVAFETRTLPTSLLSAQQKYSTLQQPEQLLLPPATSQRGFLPRRSRTASSSLLLRLSPKWIWLTGRGSLLPPRPHCGMTALTWVCHIKNNEALNIPAAVVPHQEWQLSRPQAAAPPPSIHQLEQECHSKRSFSLSPPQARALAQRLCRKGEAGLNG